MNPEDAIARQALIARLTGSPMGAASQLAPQSGMQVPAPQVMPLANNLPPAGDHVLGTQDTKKSPSVEENLAKNILPGTTHQDPHVQTLSKALLLKLIPYLGLENQSSPVQSGS